jgi:multiple sugar transport system substrate-binding protein
MAQVSRSHTIRFVLSLLLIGTLLSGCSESLLRGETNEEMSNARSADQQVVTLRLWHTYSDQETVILEEQVIPLFERLHPHIRIDAQFYPYSDQLKTMLAS